MTRTWSGMVQDGCCAVQDIHSDALNTTIHNLRVASSDTTNLRPSKHFLPWRSFQHALEFGAFYSWTFLIFFVERRILVRMQACRIFGREQHFVGFVVFRSLHQHCTTWMMLVDSIIIFSAHLHRSCCHLMDGQISIESNESFMVKMMFLKKWSQLSVKELRSATGEKMREVMYWYMKNPEAVGEDSLECYAILLMVQKSCTSWYNKYPIFYRGFYIPGGAGFWPSTVFFSFFF